MALRIALTSLGALLLCGCATSAPRGPLFTAFGPLSVCAGGAVSNAPATDAARRIIDYSPYANIRGRTLARAPVAACLSSGFGPRSSGRNHEGIDLYTGRPEPIYAGGEGVIEFKGEYGGYGETLVIRHGAGVKTRYAHLSSYAPGARKGAIVRTGELIGATGATGNATAVHLHYEIIIDGAPVNPLTVAESVPAAYY